VLEFMIENDEISASEIVEELLDEEAV